MKFIIAALALSFGSAYGQSENKFELKKPQNIQILVHKNASEVLLEVRGPFTVFNPENGQKLSVSHVGRRFLAHVTSNGIRWGEDFPGVYQLYIRPSSSEGTVFVNGMQYSGHLAVYAVGDQLQVVDDLDIESYVASTLATQFSSASFENEVWAALAIVARTNAYHAVMRNPNGFWHVIAADVGFQGAGLIVPNTPIEKAVHATRYLILVNEKQQPFAATWTEHSAGKTASYKTIFRQENTFSTSGVEAPHAALDRQDSKWTHSLSRKALASKLSLGKIETIELFTDNSSKKVYGVRVTDGQTSVDLDFLKFQDLVGANILLSSDFTVSLQGDHVHFKGFGKGHGAGLCLYSASAMAQNNNHAMHILNKFFPNTHLKNLQASWDR